MDYIFEELCSRGPLIECQQYYNENKYKINKFQSAFDIAIANGNLSVIQWLYQICPNLTVGPRNEWAFGHACSRGYLDTVKWLYEMWPNINIRALNEYAFRDACYHGEVDMVKWLYSICPTINIQANNEDAFRFACYNEHLIIAKWLLEICPTINIHADNDDAFCIACYYNRLDIVRWLCKICPYHYEVNIKNGIIVDYKVRLEKDRKWDKRKTLIFASQIAPETITNLFWELPLEVNREICGYL